MPETQRLLELVAIFASALAGAFAIWKTVGRPTWRTFQRARDLVANSVELLRVLKSVQADFRPNGGSTMRDAIARIEDRVARLDERGKALLNLSTEGVYEAGPTGSCTYINREYSEISGLMSNEAKDNGWIVALHPDDRQRVVTEWRHAVDDRRDFLSRFRFVHPCGDVVNVVSHGSAMRNTRGELLGYIGTIRRDGPTTTVGGRG